MAPSVTLKDNANEVSVEFGTGGPTDVLAVTFSKVRPIDGAVTFVQVDPAEPVEIRRLATDVQPQRSASETIWE